MIDVKSYFHVAISAMLLAGTVVLSGCGDTPAPIRTVTTEQTTTTTPRPVVSTTTTTTEQTRQP
jgi:PBP1b-binding outer membrane lipoprotein LpoB